MLFSLGCKSADDKQLGENEAIRVYVEFADGTNRGVYNLDTGVGGFQDQDFDATTAMVINWHKLPEKVELHNAKIRFKEDYPNKSEWQVTTGESNYFWFREEKINRVVLTGLKPNSIYAFQVKENGEIYRFKTMPSSLQERDVKFVIASDHQSPNWNTYSHKNAQLAAVLKPDFFLGLGDYVNCAGQLNSKNAENWARFLDYLYSTSGGYFIYDDIIADIEFKNIVIPYIALLGNHEIGDRNHIRWPADIIPKVKDLDYPKFTSANWLELLFHFPYKSEGFYNEFRFDHPNINKENAIEGYGQGGFGKLSFSNYLLLIALDNNQNWEGNPDIGLRDWLGNKITDNWEWYETNQSDIRQDLWLERLLEPDNELSAGENYQHIIPVWHRGLFGSARFNMSYKNRGILRYWLPILHRNGVKFIAEAHDHLYGRTVPMGIYNEMPDNSFIEKEYYKPLNWNYSRNLSQSYIDDFFSVDCIKDKTTNKIIGWKDGDNYIYYDSDGFRSFGYGGWGAGRRQVGEWGAGNAGWWFVDSEKGGDHFSDERSYHINLISLTDERLTSTAFSADQLDSIKLGVKPTPIHMIYWDKKNNKWSDQ